MTQIQLDCFFTAARTGSLTATAKELYLSIQSVSTHIQNLEKEFSISLFQRGPEGVVLTEEGRRFCHFARSWSETYRDTLNSIETLYYNLSLKFTVAFSEWIDPLEELFDAVAAFANEHRNTEWKALQCSNHDIMKKLAAEEINIAIMCDTQVSSGADIDMAAFAREQLAIYFPTAVHGEPIHELSTALPQIDAPYGAWSEEENLEMSRRMSGNLGLPESRCYTMPNFHSVTACAETIPCFVVSDTRFGHLCRSRQLQTRPLDIESSLCCVWNKKDENPLLPQFVTHLQNYFADKK